MFEKRLAEIEQRKIEVRQMLEQDKGDLDLDAINAEMEALENEVSEIRRRQEMASKIATGGAEVKKIASTKQEPEKKMIDKTNTEEYRRAFMEYVTRGAKSDILEFRADQTTLPSDIGAVIPTTILDRIVEKMEEYGRIWNRVTKTSLQGGVQIPVSTAKPTATWVAAGTMSDKQKMAVADSIVFSYHKLQCRVTVELVAGTVALPVFERTISNNIAEAIVKALAKAILTGSGNGEPLGIVNQEGLKDIEVEETEFSSYQGWVNILAQVPRSYRAGSVIIMNDADWNFRIVGMVDQDGQPIARVTYGLDGAIQERLLGREVIAIEDYILAFADAIAGDVVAILCRLEDYMVNSNMAITYRRYFDENTDEWISKATMIADGKLADPHGVVLVKKKVVMG